MTRILFYGSIVFFTAVTTAGFVMSRYPILVILVLLSALTWTVTWKRHPSVGLFLSLGSTATGVLLGAPGPIMLVGTGIIIVAWNAANAAHVAVSPPPPERAIIRERYLLVRFATLGVTLIATSAIILVGRSLTLHIPFFAMAGVVVAAIYAYDRLWKCLNRRS